MDNYRIHTLSPEEWVQYKDIRLRSLQTDPYAFVATYEDTVAQDESRWKARLEKDPHVFLREIESDIIVGMAGGFSHDGNLYTLNQMWIDPIARGKGLGKEVLSAIVNEVQQRGAKSIQLYVNVEQASAVALYQKMGFHIIRTDHDVTMGDGSVVDEYLMEFTSIA
jgi:ribosomal protein S18 acetylase RimI-like enzyme